MTIGSNLTSNGHSSPYFPEVSLLCSVVLNRRDRRGWKCSDCCSLVGFDGGSIASFIPMAYPPLPPSIIHHWLKGFANFLLQHLFVAGVLFLFHKNFPSLWISAHWKSNISLQTNFVLFSLNALWFGQFNTNNVFLLLSMYTLGSTLWPTHTEMCLIGVAIASKNLVNRMLCNNCVPSSCFSFWIMLQKSFRVRLASSVRRAWDS